MTNARQTNVRVAARYPQILGSYLEQSRIAVRARRHACDGDGMLLPSAGFPGVHFL